MVDKNIPTVVDVPAAAMENCTVQASNQSVRI